ncbi:hypothetical protein ERD78_16560 [Allopusillimonas soli]|uniref:DUF4175 domain-containing protein n=1 Tax=Allopusillimonas soli TaxID=659016 RepID=A0A853FFR8_9BURK|nr:hypothetical protein [Allopusillimonas soli]NYT38719.1 hypothetical protein [Allopusillimonas soli]TEA71584.1 hypothetical protein ERD78_16560 [Allopusillimonas soli]
MKIWFWPIVIGVVSTVGLLSGLLYDGLGDVVSWLALLVPVAFSALYGWGGNNAADDRRA